MQAWFPTNPTVSFLSSSSSVPDRRPRARFLCFHGSGSDSSMFTSKGTAKRPMPNPLLTYCVDNDIQLLAAHLPGRTSRLHEPMMTSALSIAETVLDLLEPMLARRQTSASAAPNRFEVFPEIPLVVAGHSMGAFIAYEFLCLMRHRHLPPAKHVLISCMVSPDTPPHLRPWAPADTLDELELQEECRGWGINTEAFIPDVWKIYEPILRQDFAVIDNYTFCEPEGHALKRLMIAPSSSPSSSRSTTPVSSPKNQLVTASFHAPLGIATTVFYAERDHRVTEEHVRKWKSVLMGSGLFSCSPSGIGMNMNAEAEFSVLQIPGGHNFFYENLARVTWMEKAIQVLDRLLIDLDYGF